MGRAYAFVQNGVVLEVEKRTLADGEQGELGRYYHGALLPFFIPIIPGENAPEDGEVRRGWIYTEGVFSEPQPFSVNMQTGELYLPPSIPADRFWQVYSDNIVMQSRLAALTEVTNSILLEQLTAEGVVLV